MRAPQALVASFLGAAAAALVLALAVPAPLHAAPPDPPKKDAKKSNRDLALEASLRKQTERVADKHADKLAPLARWCIERGLKEQAAGLLETIKRMLPEHEQIAKLAPAIDGCAAPADATKAEADKKEFEKKLTDLEKTYANDLMRLAQSCLKVGMYSRAFDKVGDVMDAAPDHKEARRILGWVRHPQDSKRWISTYEAQLLKTSVLFVNKDGKPESWIPKKDLPRWEKGERPFAGDWLTEAEEFKKNTTNEYRAWEVESEHFLIKTNIGRAAAYEFGWDLLEDFYTAFVRFYYGFFDVEAGAKLLFDVKDKRKQPKKHKVLLFPSEGKYKQHVKAEHGNDQLLLESAGFYGSSGDHCSHFYATENREGTLATLYHEVTHQLLDETKEGARGGSQGNNWVVEGVAGYMETWAKVKGKWTPGVNKDHHYLQTVKAQLAANPGFALAPFLAIGSDEFHKEGRGFNYAMSGSLCYFLAHYDGERYKEDFVQFLRAYYEGKVRKDSLPEYIQVEGITDPGKRLEALDKQFKEFMAAL